MHLSRSSMFCGFFSCFLVQTCQPAFYVIFHWLSQNSFCFCFPWPIKSVAGMFACFFVFLLMMNVKLEGEYPLITIVRFCIMTVISFIQWELSQINGWVIILNTLNQRRERYRCCFNTTWKYLGEGMVHTTIYCYNYSWNVSIGKYSTIFLVTSRSHRSSFQKWATVHCYLPTTNFIVMGSCGL